MYHGWLVAWLGGYLKCLVYLVTAATAAHLMTAATAAHLMTAATAAHLATAATAALLVTAATAAHLATAAADVGSAAGSLRIRGMPAWAVLPLLISVTVVLFTHLA